MGRGAIVIGLAAIIIGEVFCDAIFGKKANFAMKLSFVVFGAIVYYIVIGIVIWLRMDTNDLKLFTAIIVAGFASCVISGFSLRLSSTVFVAAYDLILLFFGKFPWNYPMFAEPFIAFAISSLLPKDKLRILLSRYIVVRSKEKKAKTNQKIIDACKKECLILCPKAKICYEENLENLKDALESLTEKYCSTEEFGNIEDAIPFCIKPHTMAHIIKNRLVFTHSEDFEDLIDQLDHISWKMKQKFEACTHDVHFLTDA